MNCNGGSAERHQWCNVLCMEEIQAAAPRNPRQLPQKPYGGRLLRHPQKRHIGQAKISTELKELLRLVSQKDKIAFRCKGNDPGKEFQTMRSRPLKKIVDHVQVDSNAWTLDEQL